ncbi:hypothetical protein ACFV19_07285 [Streptomyces griseoluteus]|uniref:hypothetical protein n=1 Tax=Streptomyces griseoluteus TaxID=29306 RepID=UPI0036BE191E
MQDAAEFDEYARRRDTEFHSRFLVRATGCHADAVEGWWFCVRHRVLAELGVTGLKRSHVYDSAGRFSYAMEEEADSITDSWQYDVAENLTSQGTDPGCPRGTTYTCNDAQKVTDKSGSTGTWPYDQIGNETATDSTRTANTRTDHSEMSSIIVHGKALRGPVRLHRPGPTHQARPHPLLQRPQGLSAKTTDGTDMGINRNPGGTSTP